jgi:uncharacterized membrane protein YhhN
MTLRWLSVACGAAYFVTIPWHPFPGSWIVKTLSIALLAVLAWREKHSGLALGLALSSVGDALLDLDAKLFPAGLGAFLLAHIAYTVTFFRRWPRSRRLQPLCYLVAAFSIALAAWLVPATGSLAIPVVLYVVALTAMVESSIIAEFPSKWVVIGALLFLISDAILAVNRFRSPVPARDYLVWSTYYFGQLGIALGFIASSRQLK